MFVSWLKLHATSLLNFDLNQPFEFAYGTQTMSSNSWFKFHVRASSKGSSSEQEEECGVFCTDMKST